MRRCARTQRTNKGKFDDRSVRAVLAVDAIDNKAVIVDILPSYKDVIRQYVSKSVFHYQSQHQRKKGM
jgi:hypothetical protein